MYDFKIRCYLFKSFKINMTDEKFTNKFRLQIMCFDKVAKEITMNTFYVISTKKVTSKISY